MAGSGGGSRFSDTSPSEWQERLRKQQEDVRDESFESELASALAEKTASYNERDVEKIAERLDEIQAVTGQDLEGRIDTLFGGSVAKHTHVDGLSDVDALLLVGLTELGDSDPNTVLEHIARQLKGIGDIRTVDQGRMSITVTYGDGSHLDLVPAIRERKTFKIPTEDGSGWSRINPREFARELTRANGRCSGKLVPTIKLAKAVNSRLPAAQQIASYHLEALAVRAFRNYRGSLSPHSMLEHLFGSAGTLVLTPILDRTGQTTYVDEYLGKAQSPERRRMSHVLNRVARRMKNATAAQSKRQWLDLFGDLDDD